eukprot:225125-Amphidinium_carterae.1
MMCTEWPHSTPECLTSCASGLLRILGHAQYIRYADARPRDPDNNDYPAPRGRVCVCAHFNSDAAA